MAAIWKLTTMATACPPPLKYFDMYLLFVNIFQIIVSAFYSNHDHCISLLHTSKQFISEAHTRCPESSCQAADKDIQEVSYSLFVHTLVPHQVLNLFLVTYRPVCSSLFMCERLSAAPQVLRSGFVGRSSILAQNKRRLKFVTHFVKLSLFDLVMAYLCLFIVFF